MLSLKEKGRSVGKFHKLSQEKFDNLLKDIKNAKKEIHIIYFIYKNDELGKKVREALDS